MGNRRKPEEKEEEFGAPQNLGLDQRKTVGKVGKLRKTRGRSWESEENVGKPEATGGKVGRIWRSENSRAGGGPRWGFAAGRGPAARKNRGDFRARGQNPRPGRKGSEENRRKRRKRRKTGGRRRKTGGKRGNF